MIQTSNVQTEDGKPVDVLSDMVTSLKTQGNSWTVEIIFIFPVIQICFPLVSEINH